MIEEADQLRPKRERISCRSAQRTRRQHLVLYLLQLLVQAREQRCGLLAAQLMPLLQTQLPCQRIHGEQAVAGHSYARRRIILWVELQGLDKLPPRMR